MPQCHNNNNNTVQSEGWKLFGQNNRRQQLESWWEAWSLYVGVHYGLPIIRASGLTNAEPLRFSGPVPILLQPCVYCKRNLLVLVSPFWAADDGSEARNRQRESLSCRSPPRYFPHCHEKRYLRALQGTVILQWPLVSPHICTRCSPEGAKGQTIYENPDSSFHSCPCSLAAH
jgi:hypothetical protein